MHPVDRRPDRFSFCLNEIDVFGIAQRFREQQLVDGRAAAKSDLSLQLLAAEEVAKRTADDQILFDLSEIRPGSMGAPLLQVGDEGSSVNLHRHVDDELPFRILFLCRTQGGNDRLGRRIKILEGLCLFGKGLERVGLTDMPKPLQEKAQVV